MSEELQTTETEVETGAQVETEAEVDKVPVTELERRIAAANKKHAKELKALQDKVAEFENAGKTEAEKALAEAESLKSTVGEKDRTIAELSLRFEAVLNGVPKDKLDKFIKLASLSEAEDVDEKVAETLKEWPEFATQAQEEKVPKIVAGGNPNGTTNALTKEDFSKMGYAERMELFNTNPTLYNQLK